MKIEGNTFVLTGATGGIGRAIATAIAERSGKLILVARDVDKLHMLQSQLAGKGHLSLAADITTAEGRFKVLECSEHASGLINNAGVNHFGLFEQQSEEQLREMLELNILAPILLTQALLPTLTVKESLVVNIGSGFGSIGFAGYTGYCASKFALRGFTQALRRELADSSVRVAYLAPRATATAMNSDNVVAMNRELGNTMDTVERVAEEFLALLGGGQPERYIGWPERFFVKLNALLPSVVDRALRKQLPEIHRQALAENRRYR